jgi:hypothetical protein
MTKLTSISELVDLFGSTQIIVATDDTVWHSCDCWPVRFKGQAQGKPSNRPDVVRHDGSRIENRAHHLLETRKTAMQIALEHGGLISRHYGVGLAHLPWIRQHHRRLFCLCSKGQSPN